VSASSPCVHSPSLRYSSAADRCSRRWRAVNRSTPHEPDVPAPTRVYVMLYIDNEHLRTFADDGYIVLPQIVLPDLISAARRAVADRVEQDPAPEGLRGPHFYFLVDDLPRALLAPLYESAAMSLARHSSRRRRSTSRTISRSHATSRRGTIDPAGRTSTV
jgi:hypothetical protein